ncbi:45141_t:CDS:2, partial [Gigaspora margarita]
VNRFSDRDILLVEQLDLNEVDKFIDQLKYFLETTNDLQNKSINLDNICAYFDLLIDKYPDLEDRLEKSASIIYDFIFKEAVIKILHKQEATLTSNKKQKVESFIVEQSEQLMI